MRMPIDLDTIQKFACWDLMRTIAKRRGAWNIMSGCPVGGGKSKSSGSIVAEFSAVNAHAQGAASALGGSPRRCVIKSMYKTIACEVVIQYRIPDLGESLRKRKNLYIKNNLIIRVRTEDSRGNSNDYVLRYLEYFRVQAGQTPFTDLQSFSIDFGRKNREVCKFSAGGAGQLSLAIIDVNPGEEAYPGFVGENFSVEKDRQDVDVTVGNVAMIGDECKPAVPVEGDEARSGNYSWLCMPDHCSTEIPAELAELNEKPSSNDQVKSEELPKEKESVRSVVGDAPTKGGPFWSSVEVPRSVVESVRPRGFGSIRFASEGPVVTAGSAELRPARWENGMPLELSAIGDPVAADSPSADSGIDAVLLPQREIQEHDSSFRCQCRSK